MGHGAFTLNEATISSSLSHLNIVQSLTYRYGAVTPKLLSFPALLSLPFYMILPALQYCILSRAQ